MTTTLQGIDLNDSCVLSWKEHPSTLEFTVEFSLWPESPYYRTPKKDEWTCYRTGILRFDGVTALKGLKKEAEVRFTIDPQGIKDYGNIDLFEERPDGVRISGDFGDVLVQCTSWKVEIEKERNQSPHHNVGAGPAILE